MTNGAWSHFRKARAAAISSLPSGAPWQSWGAGLVRGTVTDDGAAADQGRLAGLGLGGFDGGVDGFRVVTVNGRDDVPAVGFETGGVSSVNQPST